MTDAQVQKLRTQFAQDIAVLEHALLRHSPLPSEEFDGAQMLICGLIRGALASDEFLAGVYSMAYGTLVGGRTDA